MVEDAQGLTGVRILYTSIPLKEERGRIEDPARTDGVFRTSSEPPLN